MPYLFLVLAGDSRVHRCVPHVLVVCILKKLEVYAEQTNNVTHQHKAEVIALISIEEVEAYDIIKDYPDKLVINI